MEEDGTFHPTPRRSAARAPASCSPGSGTMMGSLVGKVWWSMTGFHPRDSVKTGITQKENGNGLSVETEGISCPVNDYESLEQFEKFSRCGHRKPRFEHHIICNFNAMSNPTKNYR